MTLKNILIYLLILFAVCSCSYMNLETTRIQRADPGQVNLPKSDDLSRQGGSIRDFEVIVNQIDRQHYKTWFFYYPTGGDLNQLAEFFHRIFLILIWKYFAAAAIE